MSINREKVLEAFVNYTNRYDPSNEMISYKIYHTYKVAEISEKIAESLNLSKDDIDLAWIIGMLHDIGRFEQAARYGTFVDAKSIDHADFGADLLFGDTGIGSKGLTKEEPNLLKAFGEDYISIEEKQLIELAIREHNKYRIKSGLNKRQAIFCKIIRDADKIDIFRVANEGSSEIMYGASEDVVAASNISPQVMANFRQEQCVSRDLRVTPADKLVGFISLGFELEFPESRSIAHKQGYIYELLKFKSTNGETEKFFEEMKERIKGHLRVK